MKCFQALRNTPKHSQTLPNASQQRTQNKTKAASGTAGGQLQRFLYLAPFELAQQLELEADPKTAFLFVGLLFLGTDHSEFTEFCKNYKLQMSK